MLSSPGRLHLPFIKYTFKHDFILTQPKTFFMKKFLTASSVILLATSVYLGYEVYKLRNTITALKKTNVLQTCSSFNYDYSNGDSVGMINYEAAKLLHDAYNRNKKGIAVYNNDGALVPGEDSKSIWFSLDRLKNFIWQIEKQNCDSGCPDSLGLRIYFGRYPNLKGYKDGRDSGLANVKVDYSGRLTLFMVPTYWNSARSVYYDFLPLENNCKAALSTPSGRIGEFDYWNRSRFILLFDMSGPTGGDSQNHGGLIPPGNPEGTSF